MNKAPAHLRKDTQKWMDGILKGFYLESHHESILQLAAESWDCIQQCKEEIKKDGLIYKNKFDEPRAHPAVKILDNNNIIFSRLIRELCLDIADPEESRPEGLS